MRDNHNQETTQDNTPPLAIGVPIRDAQTGSAGDAHGVLTADEVAHHPHTGETATPREANTVDAIAPTQPVNAETESEHVLRGFMQALLNIRAEFAEQQARRREQRHEQEVLQEKWKGFTQYFYQHSKASTLLAYGLLAGAINTTYAACGAAILSYNSKTYQVPEAVIAAAIGSSIMIPGEIYAERRYALAENPSRQWQYARTAMRVISCLAPPVIGYAVLQSMHDVSMQMSQHIAAYELGLAILFLPMGTLLMGISYTCYKDYFRMEQTPNNEEMDLERANNQPATSETLYPTTQQVDNSELPEVQSERVIELSTQPIP
jgi:cytochrome c biogenesis protein CcdA